MSSRGMTLTALARLYWDSGVRGERVCDRQRVRLFLKELKKTSRHRNTLLTALKRRGWHRKQPLPPSLLSIIERRLGEP